MTLEYIGHITHHTTEKPSHWQNRALKRPVEGIAEIAQKQFPARMACKYWIYMALCPNRKSSWVCEPRDGSKSGTTYHHSQWPTWGSLCLPTLSLWVRGPVPQRQCGLPKCTAFFDIICNLIKGNLSFSSVWDLRYKQDMTTCTSTVDNWTKFAVQKLYVWDPLYIWSHYYFIRCLEHEKTSGLHAHCLQNS